MTGAPRILPCGDCAISVDFGNVIDVDVNDSVRRLDVALAGTGVPGLVETVPTYRALMVHFNPLTTDYEALCRIILDLAAQIGGAGEARRRWRVPVVYGGDFGIDLEDMAAFAGLSVPDFIEAHAAPVYTVMMIGFLPGFSYLGGLDPQLQRPRRDVPRLKVPASSVSIGGAQTAIGSIECPSGWHLIGRTPAIPFLRGRDPVFLFDAGDEICLRPMAVSDWDRLAARAAEGDAVVERIA